MRYSPIGSTTDMPNITSATGTESAYSASTSAKTSARLERRKRERHERDERRHKTKRSRRHHRDGERHGAGRAELAHDSERFDRDRVTQPRGRPREAMARRSRLQLHRHLQHLVLVARDSVEACADLRTANAHATLRQRSATREHGPELVEVIPPTVNGPFNSTTAS